MVGCGRWGVRLAVAIVVAVAVLVGGWLATAGGEPVWAHPEPTPSPDTPEGAEGVTSELEQVVARLRNVIVGLASAIGTLFLTIAGLRWMLAGGDPGEIDKAKRALSGAGVGYAIAILATVLMTVLDYVVQGSGG
ncbi:hypothetical protein GCM10022402_44660 [Salinactinospora qingdaonensis]|uniref:DUF4190 domain-containing protein n=2 Tax=Salinactinospora qingdaonensis TaxID=702744 RepID=A0ABP7GDZ9_9ACTN